MSSNDCAKRWFFALLCPAVLVGCRAQSERGEPDQTIVFHEASRPIEHRAYDTGDRAPDCIEVVVADPRGGGGSSALTALVGRSVKVQFRRDVLGLAAPAPVPPTGQGPGGRAVSIVGTVQSVSGGWLVLEREQIAYWVPLASILMIEAPDSPTTAPAVE